MTDKQTKAIQTMRERYLGEYMRTYKKPDRITLFEEIRDMAVAAGVSAWEKFADATLSWLQKDMEAALSLFDEAITLDPELAYPWHGKGTVLRNLKRYDEAIAAYDKAIALDPEYAYPWNGKGNVLNNLKRYDEAMAAYEKMIQLSPGYPDPHYNLGVLHWEQERPDDAVKLFQRAIELGLDSEWKEMAESWIARARRMLESKKAGKSDEESTQEDRSSDDAIFTELREAMKGDLPEIQAKKTKFEEGMQASVSKARIIGTGRADDMLLVLRDWNSYSPILRRDVRDQNGPGPDERLGGGYFLAWKGHGIVIDPGMDFVTQLYRKELSIADVDTIIVTHCHLDHIRDLESLVDLNYRDNQKKGFKPHPRNNAFRQIQFRFCDSAFMKYSEYLKASGCCDSPQQLVRGARSNVITEFIDVLAVPAEHLDINGRANEAIGLVFVLKDDDGKEVLRVGFTSDSRWFEELPDGFMDCNVLVAHLGTIETGEGEGGGSLKTDLKNHLGTRGCFRLMHGVKPKLFVMGEFGEELVETRFKILKVFNKLKPVETRFVLGGDSNLAIGLSEKLSVYCSHPKCATLRTRIELDQVHPILGGDFLFQYTCPEHGLEPG